MARAKRTKKPTCRKASAYACGFSCITMTKACRQALEGQAIEVASVFASLITDGLPKADKPVEPKKTKTRKKKEKTLDQLLDKAKRRSKPITVVSDKGNIVYKASTPVLFTAQSIKDNDFKLDDEEIAKQLQDWNGELQEISWTNVYGTDGEGDEDESLSKTQLKLALEARRTWPSLREKLKPGTLLYNTPIQDRSSTLNDTYTNTRARLYEKAGFGKLEQVLESDAGFEGMPRQFAIVQPDGSLRPIQTVKPEGLMESVVKYTETNLNND